MLRLVGILAMALLVVAACNQNLNNSVVVTEEKDGKTIQLQKGDTFTVNLRGNPTTGYLWEIQSTDSTIIRQTGDVDYKADNTDPGYDGSAGTFTFRFTAIHTGRNNLLFIYHRPFEPDTPPEKTFSVKVIVK